MRGQDKDTFRHGRVNVWDQDTRKKNWLDGISGVCEKKKGLNTLLVPKVYSVSAISPWSLIVIFFSCGDIFA